MTPAFDAKACANYFHAFGFLKLPGFFSSQEMSAISTEFDNTIEAAYGELSRERNYLLAQFIDLNQNLSSLLTHPKLNLIIEALLGKNFLYKGSDGNVFRKSTGWHRDYLIRNKSCKVLIYLQGSSGDSSALRVIPGTQFVNDRFSSTVGNALCWPEQPFQGGFDEFNIFGEGHDPTTLGMNRTLPQIVVANNPGDIIIFNHNLIHCTNATQSASTRRLLGLHFVRNPLEHPMRELRESLYDELKELCLIEMKAFNLSKMFGHATHEHKSPLIQRMIEPLRDLRLDINTEFNGTFSSQTGDSICFCNRLKITDTLNATLLN